MLYRGKNFSLYAGENRNIFDTFLFSVLFSFSYETGVLGKGRGSERRENGERISLLICKYILLN